MDDEEKMTDLTKSNIFIISLNYVASLLEIDKHKPAHIEFLKRHYDAGRFIASGPKVPRTGGVILAFAKDKLGIMEVLKDDPFFIHSLAEYEITEFSVSLCSSGLNQILELK